MSYRCGICDTVVAAGFSQTRYTVHRSNGQIAVEIPTCGICHAMLTGGIPMATVYRQQGKPAAVAAIAKAGRTVPLGGKIVDKMRTNQGSFPTIQRKL